ncbi:hypothetical protein ACVGOW_19845 [Pseudonocardia saturnea]
MRQLDDGLAGAVAQCVVDDVGDDEVEQVGVGEDFGEPCWPVSGRVRIAQASGSGLDGDQRGAQVVSGGGEQRGAQFGGLGAAAGVSEFGADLLVAQREQGLPGDGLEHSPVGGGQRPVLADQVDVGLDGDVDVGLFGAVQVGARRRRSGTQCPSRLSSSETVVRLKLLRTYSRSWGSGSGPTSRVRENEASSAVSAAAGWHCGRGIVVYGQQGGAVDHQRDQHGDQHHRHQGDHVLALGSGEGAHRRVRKNRTTSVDRPMNSLPRTPTAVAMSGRTRPRRG